RALPAGDLVGTPAYISPEHTGRTREGCDVRSDLYSLGVTLYELLTGALLFGRGAELQVLEQALERAASGAPTLVLISGREGSGRSELVRALIRGIAT